MTPRVTALTYQDLVRELFPRLAGGVRWGLDRTERLLDAVGDPHRRFRALHIGGTNGKGSVSAILASILRETGVRTGLYTSPHLCSFRERVQVNGRPLSEEALVGVARRLWPAVQREYPSFFEATTAIAFLAFAEAEVEAAIVEVGLGGRLDATNVILPESVVLTNVALDHAEYLGDTLESIAREKSGIIKPGVPVVTAERDPVVLEIFRHRAREVGAAFHVLDRSSIRGLRVGFEGTCFQLRTEHWGDLAVRLPLIGAHQATNAALAVRALELLPPDLRPDREAVLRGLRQVRWPGRLQLARVGPALWIFDVAHNPAGVEALVATLRALPLPRPVVVVFGVLSDKDWRGMLPPLLDMGDAVVLTVPPTAPEHRRWDPTEVLQRLPGAPAEVVSAFDQAIDEAHTRAAGGSVIVTGSFHTVGDALCMLGLAPYGVDAPLPGSPSGA